MSTTPTPADEWSPCPEGELQKIAQRQTAVARRAARRRSTWGAAASVLVAVGVVVTAGLASGKAPAKINCKGCHQRFTEFYETMTSGEPKIKDERIVEGMKRHLKKCGRCRAKFREKFPKCPLGYQSPEGRYDSHKAKCGVKDAELSVERRCNSRSHDDA
ncbi:MAG: hypothetical protein CMJ58_23090 [Planctomycetaceae bacterium]|nr:hypothetical protein [Planctomycetaceae bacterium]